MPASAARACTMSWKTPWYTPTRALHAPSGSSSAARVIEHQLELAVDPPLQRLLDRFEEHVGRKDALFAGHRLEYEREVDARGLRVGFEQREVGAVGAQDACHFLDCVAHTL